MFCRNFFIILCYSCYIIGLSSVLDTYKNSVELDELETIKSSMQFVGCMSIG